MITVVRGGAIREQAWWAIGAAIAVVLGVPAGPAQTTPPAAESSTPCGEGASPDCRRVETRTSADASLIRLESVASTPPDAIELAFNTNDGQLETAFEVETQPEEGDGNATMRGVLLIRLQQLVEFEDEDADTAFDSGETVRSWWALSDRTTDRTGGDRRVPSNGTVTWQALREEEAQAGNLTGRQVMADGRFVTTQAPPLPLPLPVDEVTPGRVQVTLSAYGHHVVTPNMAAQPAEILLKLAIYDYPFASETSRLALVFDAVAEDRLIEEHPSFALGAEGVASHVSVAGRDALLALQWATSAAAQGVDTHVTRSLLRQEVHGRSDGSQSLDSTYALSYARSTNLTQDAKTGAALGEDAEVVEDEFMGVPSLGPFLVAVGVAGGLAVASRRTRP